MVNKFLIAIIAVVAVMAALVFLPGVGKQDPQFELDYTISHMTRTEAGLPDLTAREVLSIENDGSALHYTVNGTTVERKFSLSGEEMKMIRALVLETGFMEIPVTNYPENDGLANFTRYRIEVQAGGDSQVITWVNAHAHNGTVPSLITNIGSQLDAVIKRHV